MALLRNQAIPNNAFGHRPIAGISAHLHFIHNRIGGVTLNSKQKSQIENRKSQIANPQSKIQNQ
jgi:hypothetical protein